jgi:dynein heavy chain
VIFVLTVSYCTYRYTIYCIFRLSLPEIKATAVEARQTMDTWKQAYLDVRKKIELSGRDARWEFDRKKLFERSDYIAQVCSDVHDVAQVSLIYYCTIYHNMDY